MTKKKGAKKMVRRSLSIDPNLWKQAQEKAGLTSLSAIIRQLIKLWVEGKIDLSQ